MLARVPQVVGTTDSGLDGTNTTRGARKAGTSEGKDRQHDDGQHDDSEDP
jgi:hypothetical protein